MIHDYYKGMMLGMVSGLIVGGVVFLCAGFITGYGWAHRDIGYERILKQNDEIIELKKNVYNWEKKDGN